MISVTRINGEEVVINADLIETIEATPDTMISLTTGRKIMVKESVDEVIDRVTDYESGIHRGIRQGVPVRVTAHDDTAEDGA